MTANELKLVFPTAAHEPAVWAFRQKHFDNGEARINGSSALHSYDSYAKWLADAESDLTTSKPGWVCATIYLAMLGDMVVGMIQIRHELNEHLSQVGGHIGYSIAPSLRGRGYGSRQLALAARQGARDGISPRDDNV